MGCLIWPPLEVFRVGELVIFVAIGVLFPIIKSVLP